MREFEILPEGRHRNATAGTSSSSGVEGRQILLCVLRSSVVDSRAFTTEDTEDTENFISGLDFLSALLQYGVVRHVVEGHNGSLPLSEPVLLILLSLAEQPRHGYSILKDVEQMSDGRVVLSTGTLYARCDGCSKMNGSSESKKRTRRGAARRIA